MHEAYDSETHAAALHRVQPRLGIVGGGQLARMTAFAALQLGCEVFVLERNKFSPAEALATRTLVGDWDQPEALAELASLVDVVSLENEFVDARTLAALEASGHPRRWCADRNWPATIPTHRRFIYRCGTTLACQAPSSD